MTRYYRCLKSDVMKMKRQSMLLVHLLVPLAGIALFLGYYSISPWAPVSKAGGYLQVVAASFPTMIGIVCSMAADQEYAAGKFQQLLTSPSKLLPFISKLTLLLLLGFGSVLLAFGGFGAGFLYLLHDSPFGFGFYLRAACILFVSCIFLYNLHFFISLRFGKGASIGVGITESLLSALLLTGLGDGNWHFIPCAWGARFLTILVQFGTSSVGSVPSAANMHEGIWFCAGETLVLMLLLGLWIWRWEGRKSLE
ncbi:lantibiotic immunity ABC transporter MutG family permease subunit [Paenibacillus caui]|uniref:lantibiotic immunity ABC transporter MutG family permease subunit n=1 Tax=Paenibacillus caui TaxID=2873927 RepID=UPI001CA9DDC0|nr:lantibiotic immunity ABC transporter MutG family permease subunit [Paenibacillus caui]